MPKNTPVLFLACKVFAGIMRDSDGVSHVYLDYGLHAVPKKLNLAVQEHIDAIEEPSLIVLGYGLCGNGLHQIRAGKHTLIIPKADDCVAIFMGSRKRYMEQFNNKPGSYYLTKGWLEVGSDPLSEYQKLVKKYDVATADWVMAQQYQHYKRLVLVAHRQEDLDAYRPRALEVAAYCERFGMVFEEYLGSETYMDQIGALLDSQQIESGAFIVVQPGSTLKQEMFIVQD